MHVGKAITILNIGSTFLFCLSVLRHKLPKSLSCSQSPSLHPHNPPRPRMPTEYISSVPRHHTLLADRWNMYNVLSFGMYHIILRVLDPPAPLSFSLGALRRPSLLLPISPSLFKSPLLSPASSVLSSLFYSPHLSSPVYSSPVLPAVSPRRLHQGAPPG